MPSGYAGAIPPASSLGAWLLRQVQEIRDTITALLPDIADQTGKVKELQVAVDALRTAAERSAKVQTIQAVELAQVKSALVQTQQKLNGLKISRGQYKSRAQKLLQSVEKQLN